MLSVTARLESSALDPVVPDLQGEFDGSMFLKVLAAATAGKYPCAELVYNQATGAWDNLPNEAKAFELNGATLSVGQILKGRQAGHDLNSTGEVCVLYAVQASGGGGAAGTGPTFVRFNSGTGSSTLHNGSVIQWSASGGPSAASVPVFISTAMTTSSPPFIPAPNQVVMGLLTGSYTASETPGGVAVTKPLYIVYGLGYPPSGVFKPIRESALLGTYYGLIQIVSTASKTALTWSSNMSLEVLLHNINSTGAAGSLVIGKNYIGVLSGSSFASGTAFGAQANGYPIYTVASP